MPLLVYLGLIFCFTASLFAADSLNIFSDHRMLAEWLDPGSDHRVNGTLGIAEEGAGRPATNPSSSQRYHGPDPPVNLEDPVPADSHWWGGFGRSGCAGIVRAFGHYEGDLLIGGNFDGCRGFGDNGLARWNGVDWAGFGNGMEVEVMAVDVYQHQIMAGVKCYYYSDLLPSCIRSWDGDSWGIPGGGIKLFEELSDFIPFTVHALAVYKGELFAGGCFWEYQDNMPDSWLLRWDGEAWQSTGASLNGPVYSMITYDDRLVIGGRFTQAGGMPAYRIAAWDGSSWSTFGSGINDDIADPLATRWIEAMTIYDGDLIVGGRFARAGSLAVDRLAAWDGISWRSLGFEAGYIPQGVPEINALCVYSGKLFAGGRFKQSCDAIGDYLAWYDGVCWTGSDSVLSGQVEAFAFYNDTLVLGGLFSYADGQVVYNVAGWDGASWHQVGPTGDGLSSQVHSLAVHEGQLIAGGEFVDAGQTHANHVAAWDGSAWHSMGDDFANGVQVLAGYDGDLMGAALKLVKRWNGISWESFGTALATYVRCMVDYEGDLVVGTDGVYSWNGASWDPLGLTDDGKVYALIDYDGYLVAAGDFTYMNDSLVNNIAAWDGVGWQTIDGGLLKYGKPDRAVVRDLAIFGGDLVAAGGFRNAGGKSAYQIARWTGQTWEALGSGIEIYDDVYALEVYNGTLIAGGDFDWAGGHAASKIARWNGSCWVPLGSGIGYHVEDLAVYDGCLYVGGSFMAAGDKRSYYIARWKDDFPGMVMHFHAYPCNGAVRLEWRNPSTDVFLGTHIRYSATHYPEDISDGDPVPSPGGGFFHGIPGQDQSFVHYGLTNGQTYYYTAFAYDADLNCSTPAWVSAVPADSIQPSPVPLANIRTIDIGPVCPNPATATATVCLTIPTPQHLRAAVYDTNGRRLIVLFDDLVVPGTKELTWDGTCAGANVPSGVYFLRIETAQVSVARKLLLIR